MPHCCRGQTNEVRISVDGVIALLGCLVLALLPIPRRAEGVRIGLFAAVLGYVFFDAARRRSSVPIAHKLVAVPVRPTTKVELPPVAEEDRLTASELLADFSILRHLRRQGAVSDAEFEAKKADILHRV